MKKVIAMLVLFSTGVFAQQKGTFTDSRDNKTYKAVKIAQTWWMAENLNYAVSGSKCYDNNSWNCTKYGRLYDWNAAMRACPYGWHLPSDAEWNLLMAAVGGEETAREKLKVPSFGGTDDYGFSALPGGGGGAGGFFYDVGDYGWWWCASEISSSLAYSRFMDYYDERASSGSQSKSALFSVRCVKD